jgi:hypothetical protein
MLAQPVSVTTFSDKEGRTISLGGAGSPGAPVVMDPQGKTVQIDFTADPVPGFSIPQYIDPHDPTVAAFELRWAVIPQLNGTRVVSERIIIGCRQTNATRPVLPVNLDTWVQK